MGATTSHVPNLAGLRDLRDIAAELLLPAAQIRAMVRRGEYPELLRVARGEYRVRVADHEAWKAGRWTGVEMAKQQIAAAFVKGALPINPRARRHA
jgi:hypothetical protein